MSADLRNSILLWVGALAYFGVFWMTLQFDLFRGVSGTWLATILGIIGVGQLVRIGWGLYQRRSSNPANPNRL
jgi:hypothetical protein